MKMYKKPIIEVSDLKTASLMQGLIVSFGSSTDSSNPPPAGMPKRGDLIP